MRVLMLSKACVVGAYQRKLEELARLPELELTVIVPPYWRDERGIVELERLVGRQAMELEMAKKASRLLRSTGDGSGR